MDTNTSTESPSKKEIEAGPMRPYQPDLRCTITKMPFIYILFCSLHFDTGRAENLRFCSKVLILTVSSCFPFPVLMALLASHCFSLYWVSLIFFFNSFYGADCLFLTTWRKKILIFLCIWLMTLIKSNWICNGSMLLRNGYWIKFMNFILVGVSVCLLEWKISVLMYIHESYWK